MLSAARHSRVGHFMLPVVIRMPHAVELVPLEDKAKNAIIKYSKSITKMKGWTKQSTRSFLFAITQRIGEIKRKARNANRNHRRNHALSLTFSENRSTHYIEKVTY